MWMSGYGLHCVLRLQFHAGLERNLKPLEKGPVSWHKRYIKNRLY